MLIRDSIESIIQECGYYLKKMNARVVNPLFMTADKKTIPGVESNIQEA